MSWQEAKKRVRKYTEHIKPETLKWNQWFRRYVNCEPKHPALCTKLFTLHCLPSPDVRISGQEQGTTQGVLLPHQRDKTKTSEFKPIYKRPSRQYGTNNVQGEWVLKHGAINVTH